MSAYSRIEWLHKKIASGCYPNSSHTVEKFSISQRQAQRDIEMLKNEFGAPLKYSPNRKGYYYTEPFELPIQNEKNETDYVDIVSDVEENLKEQNEDMQLRLPYSATLKIEIDYLDSNCRKILSAFEPKILPLTDTLLYHYDFGDGWCVKITCLDGYYINDSWDYPNEDGVVLAIADDNQAIKDWEFFDCREHKKIKGEYAELLRNVVSKKSPICVYSDGLALLDDVGGIGGFVEMLKTIHGDDQEAAESMREWSSGQGWFGRSIKVENML